GQFVEPAHQVVGAAAPHRRGGDHRYAELGGQLVEVDVDAAPARNVDHVEDEQQREPDALQFEHEAQRQPQVRGIGDAEEQVGCGFRLEAAEHEITRDLFVGRARTQRIGAGQVDQVDAAAAGRLQHAAFALDGDAGIVGDLLAA